MASKSSRCPAAPQPAWRAGSWQHLNLHGEFDFSDEALKDALRFDVEALFAFQWEPPAGPLV